jgi:hypothetical protein
VRALVDIESEDMIGEYVGRVRYQKDIEDSQYVANFWCVTLLLLAGYCDVLSLTLSTLTLIILIGTRLNWATWAISSCASTPSTRATRCGS